MRPRLEIKLLDLEVVALQSSSNNCIQRRALRQWIQSQHLAKLLPVRITPTRPISPRFYIRQRRICELLCFAAKIIGEHSVSAGGVDRLYGTYRTDQSEDESDC